MLKQIVCKECSTLINLFPEKSGFIKNIIDNNTNERQIVLTAETGTHLGDHLR